MYAVCSGAAAGKQDSCADEAPLWDEEDGQTARKGPNMSPVAPGRTLRKLCREEDGEVRAIPLFIAGPKAFLSGCRRGVGIGVPADKREAVCAAAAARLDDPAAAAAAAAAVLGMEDRGEISHIAHDFAVSSGRLEPKDCASPDPFKVEMCLAAYWLRRQRAGGKPECGSYGLCRMMTGGGAAACEPYARRALELFCRRKPS